MIRLWNTAAGTITGVPEEDVLGRKIEDVVQGWHEIGPLIPVASKPGEPVRAETVPVVFGGRELWISGSGVGFEEGTVYAFRDLTEERALEELKAEFVATVSHELRTPLAAIYGSAQTIRRTDIELDPEIQNQLLGVIASESDRLGTIVNDLLVAGRLDAGQLPVTIGNWDPVELAGAVVEAARTHLPDDDRGRAARAETGSQRRRRPGPAPAGAREPRRQRGQVLPRRRSRRALRRERRQCDPVLGGRTAASASPPRSTAGSSKSSTASIRT